VILAGVVMVSKLWPDTVFCFRRLLQFVEACAVWWECSLRLASRVTTFIERVIYAQHIHSLLGSWCIVVLVHLMSSTLLCSLISNMTISVGYFFVFSSLVKRHG
jgi:hypothetical protein